MQEYFVDVSAGRGIGGEKPEVRVLPRRAQMIVAGAEMRVLHEAHPAVPIGLASRQQRELRVRLEAEYAVNDLRPGALQPLGPIDVRFLVEARKQLDDHGHFLAAPRGVEQRFHQDRVHAGAINSLLHRDDIGVLRGAADELDDGLERLVGMMQQNVPRTDRREQIRRRTQPFGQSRHERRILERFERHLVDQ